MYEHYLPENIENILLVTVDCLRRDHLELYGYSRRTMPYLTKSIGGGLVVEEAHTNSPFTRASLPSLFTSSYPLEGDPFYTIRERPITITPSSGREDIKPLVSVQISSFHRF